MNRSGSRTDRLPLFLTNFGRLRRPRVQRLLPVWGADMCSVWLSRVFAAFFSFSLRKFTQRLATTDDRQTTAKEDNMQRGGMLQYTVHTVIIHGCCSGCHKLCYSCQSAGFGITPCSGAWTTERSVNALETLPKVPQK